MPIGTTHILIPAKLQAITRLANLIHLYRRDSIRLDISPSFRSYLFSQKQWLMMNYFILIK